MNSFVDSPFLFFVDNVPPIFAENPGEDQRKIIEISDACCDAITPTMPTQNKSQYSPTRTTTVKNSRSRYEDKSAHKFYREKWRQNEELPKNLGKTFSTHKQVENAPRPNIDEHRGKRPTTHNEVSDNPTPKKTSNTKDMKMSPRMQSERPRLNRWNKGNVQEIPQELPDDHAASNSERRPMSCPTRKRPMTPQSPPPKVEPKIDAKIVPKVEEKFTFDKRNTMVTLEPDYPEVFDHNISKDRWQNLRTRTTTNLKKPIDEPPQKVQRSSRYQKSTKIPAAKANNTEQTIEDLQAPRIRSRTRSPPKDRKKRTQSFPKSSPNDLEQMENQQNPETMKDPNSPVCNYDSDQSGSVNKIRKFVDRAVDKDSICDISEVSTSTDAAVVPKSSKDTGKSEKIIGFWEFVPLEDENDPRCKIAGNRKTRCLLDHRMFRDTDYHPLRRHLVNDDDPSTSKPRVQESVKTSLDPDRNFISENLKYTDHCSLLNPGDLETIKGDTVLPCDTYRREESARSVEVLHRTSLNSQTEVNTGHNREKLHSNDDTVAKHYGSSHDQSWGEPKHQRKPAHALSFGWPGRNRYLKRENEAKHGEESGKKKKLQNEEKTSGLKFIEKTAACLKRKLEGSQKEDSDLEKSSRMNVEKKIRSEVSTNSKLPIRIGKRLKSKNPIAWKFSDSLKSGLPDKEQNKGPEYVSTVRSRTKPKIKPSVEVHRIVIDSDDTPACPVSVDNVRTGGRTEDQSINGRSEKLGEHLKYVEQDSRRKEFANRFYARNSQGYGMLERMDTNVTRNIGMKEKCFFHVHDEENRICDQYCKGMRSEKVCH
ncbi:uncharacterized protein LOC143213337 [Lasioglossum baleicum]|uniref:uncharacterized protein LOC143213337 n=1 Tax=Lasioglossum baleicum TaxID=434251 RepID=UPI003FCE9C77